MCLVPDGPLSEDDRIWQNGDQIAYAADAKVIHYHEYGYVEQFQRNFDIGAAHAEHPQIVGDVSASGEGVRLVKETAVYLIRKKRPWLIVPLVFGSAAKYIGFQMGRHYRLLPYKIRPALSRNKSYWKKTIDEQQTR